MSFDAVITNITSVRNLKDQEKEFFKNLRLRAKLNEEYDQALTKRSYIEKYDLPKTLPPVERSLVEERNDVNYQYQLALKKLLSYVRPEVATEIIGKLTEPQIVQLNLHFEAIKKLIPLDGRDISATYFMEVFKRYEEFLVESGYTGVKSLTTSSFAMLPPPPKKEIMSGVPLPSEPENYEPFRTPISLTPRRPRPPGRIPSIPSSSDRFFSEPEQESYVPPSPSQVIRQLPGMYERQPGRIDLGELQSKIAGRRVEHLEVPVEMLIKKSTPSPSQEPKIKPTLNLGELKSRIESRKEIAELPTEADIIHKESRAIQKRNREMIALEVPELQRPKEQWIQVLESGGRDPKVIVTDIVRTFKNKDLIGSLTRDELNKLIAPFGIKGRGSKDLEEKFFDTFKSVLEEGSGLRRRMKGYGIIGGVRCSTTKCKEPSTDEIIGIIKAGNDNINLKKELLKRT